MVSQFQVLVFVFQVLVLAFSLLVWWLARRDLSLKAAETYTPAIEEWERLRAVVEALTADLERRAAAAEQRIAEAEQRSRHSEMRTLPMPDQFGALQGEGFPTPGPLPDRPRTQEAAPDDPYAGIHALVAAGISDAGEISRRTGVALGEVNLILGLRDRQARL